MKPLKYSEVINLINDIVKKYVPNAEKSIGRETSCDYICGEYHLFESAVTNVRFTINYKDDYPCEIYAFTKKSHKDIIKGVEISILQITRINYESKHYKFYAESPEVLNAIMPFVKEALEDSQKAFDKAEKEKQKNEKDKRYQEFLKLKKEFEPEEGNAAKKERRTH